MKTPTSSARSAASSAARSSKGTREKPGRRGPKRLLNAASPAAERQPVETVLARDHLRAPRGRAAELQRRLDSLGARAREQHPSERGRGALQERRGKQTGQRRDAELHFPGRLELERLDQGCAGS